MANDGAGPARQHCEDVEFLRLIPTTLLIRAALFLAQRQGSDVVGAWLWPICLAYF